MIVLYIIIIALTFLIMALDSRIDKLSEKNLKLMDYHISLEKKYKLLILDVEDIKKQLKSN